VVLDNDTRLQLPIERPRIFFWQYAQQVGWALETPNNLYNTSVYISRDLLSMRTTYKIVNIACVLSINCESLLVMKSDLFY